MQQHEKQTEGFFRYHDHELLQNTKTAFFLARAWEENTIHCIITHQMIP